MTDSEDLKMKRFTSRYGYDVPNPDPEYEKKLLETLEEMLEQRGKIGQSLKPGMTSSAMKSILRKYSGSKPREQH